MTDNNQTLDTEVAAFMQSLGFEFRIPGDAPTGAWCKVIEPEELGTCILTPTEAAFFHYVVQERERAARIDELSNVQLEHGHYLTQTFVDGQSMTIEERIAQLSQDATTAKICNGCGEPLDTEAQYCTDCEDAL